MNEALNIQLSGHRLAIQNSVKYLDVVLDRGLTETPHVNYLVGKADRAIARLTRLTPQVGGASG